MKEIKFRAWDKKREEWYGASNPHSLTFYGFHIFGECTMLCGPKTEDLEHIEITQWTGLTDKNGKDIYEGDIVEAPHDFGPAGFEIRRFSVYFHEYCGSYLWNYWLMDKAEVIGNIYENGDLLEKN